MTLWQKRILGLGLPSKTRVTNLTLPVHDAGWDFSGDLDFSWAGDLLAGSFLLIGDFWLARCDG